MKRGRGSFKRVTLAVVSLVAVTLAFVTALPTDTSDARSNIVDMGLEAYYDREEDAGMISWGTPNQEEPYVYQAFSKKPEDDEFQSISATDLNREVKVLNVYPRSTGTITYTTWNGETRTVPRSASLERWMEEPNEYHEKGFGMGLIEVDLVTQEEFNKNPKESLTNSKGEWDYDAVFFGATDRHNDEDLTEHSRDVVIEFINTGRGLLYGHDTIDGLGNKNFLFGTLREYGNIKLRYLDDIGNLPLVGSPTATIRKEGLLTKFPWEIGEIGTNLSIPFTHTGGQLALGDIWMDFSDYDYDGNSRRGPVVSHPVTGKGTNNFYLTSWGNTAMIQTGHTAGASTPDEQKVFANTLFYLAQLTKDTSIVDRSAMDVYAPEFVTDEVKVDRGMDKIDVSFPEAIDPIKQYEYYVKATGQDTGRELFSETVKTDNVSGMVGYSYVLDNSPNTQPDESIDIKVGEDTTITIPNDTNQPRYVHISAVDYQGNVSEPLTVDLHESFHTIDGRVFRDLDENGVRNGNEPFISNHQVSLVNSGGQQLRDLNNKPYVTTTDNNGYYKFRVYKGGNYRIKVNALEDWEFTNIPQRVGSGELPNHVSNRASGTTNTFLLNPEDGFIDRNAGFRDTRIYYTIKHINKETGNSIAPEESGIVRERVNNQYITRPIKEDTLNGYTYMGEYRINNEPIRRGNSYTIRHGERRGELELTYYYNWEGVDETSKRMQGDDDGSPLPVDFYTNAGIHARRGSDGRIISSGMQVNTTGLVETHEAPIAIQAVEINIDLLDEDNNVLHSELKYVDDDTYLINDEYLNKVKVNSYLGESSTVRRSYGITPYIINLTEENSRKYNMSDAIGGTEEARRMAIEGTDVEFGVNEDSHYLGRWAYRETDLRFWIPHELLGLSTDLYDTSKVNDIEKVKVTIDTRVYNIMEHQYEPRVGADGLEYYEYVGTELKQGYYQHDSEGNNTGVVRSDTGTISPTTYLDVSEIKVGQYINSEGFNVENGEIKTVQNKVATEKFDDGGQTVVNGNTVINSEEDRESSIQEVNEEGNYETKPTEEQLIVNYYEEFGYIPHHVEDELNTQQAVPVGGKFYYINPYEYTLMPSYTNTRLSELSGFHFDDPPRNHYEFLHEGKFAVSEVEYDSRDSGFYVSDVDEVEEYKSQFTPITEQNKNTMGEVLQTEKEFKNYNINRTSSYEEYRNSNESSGYIPTNEIQGDSGLAYRLPVTYVHNIMEFILEDVVAVGKDTGYPVKSNSETIEEDYKERYIEDNGQEPSETDKLVTMNKGSIYLIPTNKPNQTLEDEYRTRLFINNMGISQTSLVQDNTLSIGKYLYGRGDNTLYSGTRAQVDVGGSFETDQMLGKDLQPIELNYMNGTRLNIGEELADELLKVE